MNITKNFTLAEAQTTQTGLNNVIPNEDVMANVKAIAEYIMQPLRDYLGTPVIINSWYRSPQVNAKIGGSKTSQHMKGEAVDFVCDNLDIAFNYIKDNKLEFDQLIYENNGVKKWIHVSYKRNGKNRRQVMFAVKKGKEWVYKYV